MTAWRRIQRSQCTEIVAEVLVGFRLPDTVPVLMLDAKHFRFAKKPYTLYVAFDATRMRPLSWILLPRHELRIGYDRILKHMKREKVRIGGVVSDGHKGLVPAVHDWYPHAIHQQCAFHALADALRTLGGKSFLARGGRKLWERVRRAALGCATLPEARRSLAALKRAHPRHLRTWAVLARRLAAIYAFAEDPELLGAYRTSNRIENFMGTLEQRIKTFRGMKTSDTCVKIISSFIRIKYKKPTKK